MIQTNHSLITAKGTTSFYHRERGVVKETVKTETIKTIPMVANNREAGAITNEPHGRFVTRIGHTFYCVGVHFSNTSTETAKDKILRLVRTEAENGEAAINP